MPLTVKKKTNIKSLKVFHVFFLRSTKGNYVNNINCYSSTWKLEIIVINGSKISIHRFIATALFCMDKLTKNDHTHLAISTTDECGHSLSACPYETALSQ